MSKKRSFFERLTGNLTFDDIEDEDVSPNVELKKIEADLHERERELRPNFPQFSVREQQKALEEEVGELPIDLYETPNEIILQTLIAGVVPENLSINITRDTVTVSGRREENKSISKDNYHINELYWGAFARTVKLPTEVDIDGAEAIERHGMLMIKLPRLDKARKANLKVKSI
jgi:HSP20 family protein